MSEDLRLQDQEVVPNGLCQCGCYQQTALITATKTRQGRIKGERSRYLPGHNGRRLVRYVEVPTGYRTHCWIWQLAKTKDGYGRETAPTGKSVLAHRRYFEQRHGPIPLDLQLDHLCRIRACVNPDHLELVTGSENVRRGSNTRLTPEAVHEIRSSTEKQAVLARRYGVRQPHISRIRSNHTWREP